MISKDAKFSINNKNKSKVMNREGIQLKKISLNHQCDLLIKIIKTNQLHG